MYSFRSIFDDLKHRKKFFLVSFFVILIFTLYFWRNIFITIHPGHAGVKFSRFLGGVVTDKVYTPGSHLIFPWDSMGIFSTRMQTETDTVQALTNNGLAVNISVTLRYQLIEDKLPELQELIGSEYVTVVLRPLITSIIRQKIGNISVESIYSPQIAQTLEDLLLIGATQAIGKIPININAFVVTKITLPRGLTKSIENKLIAEQDVLRYEHLIDLAQEEAKRLNVEGVGIRGYQELINANMTDNFLQYEGIKASTRLANSPNSKIVIFGGGDGNLPLIMNMTESNEKTPSVNSLEVPNQTINTENTQANEKQTITQDITRGNIRQAEASSEASIYENFTTLMQKLDKILQK